MFKNVVLLLLAVLVLTSPLLAQNIVIDVGDVTAAPGSQVEIPVYFENLQDTLWAFELWVQFGSPNAIHFNNDPKINTVGTLWDGRNISAQTLTGYELQIIGSSDFGDIGILPHSGSQPLFNVVANVYANPDTMFNNPILLHLEDQFIDNFNLTDRWGNAIGFSYDTVMDTTCLTCAAWVGEICLDYAAVDCETTEWPIDSISVDTNISVMIDTDYVEILDGSVTIYDDCGDINGDGNTNILDVIQFIECLYGIPEPGACDNAYAMDINCNGSINILDVTYYIAYLYSFGPALHCCPIE